MLTTRSQRWREKRSLYVDDLSVIDPRAYSVDVIEPKAARAFVALHHYLPSWPAAQLAVGLFGPGRGCRATLVGVAVFAVPAIGSVITRHAGLASDNGTTLARFILLPDVAGNGESFFLSRALGHLRREKRHLEAVVSYSDPSAGHIGRIYAALSSAYRGQMPERTSYRIRAQPISGRTLSKIRLGERGASGAIDQLIAFGAPRLTAGETPADWLSRLTRERVLSRARHPGLHAYCFELSHRARQAGAKLPRKPYPTMLTLPHPELPLLAA